MTAESSHPYNPGVTPGRLYSRVVEMNPLVDPGYTTALNVNRCIREMLVGLALRRQGITTPDYLDPRMRGDA